ncbi:MAG: dual specificity protein phosphatase family protein [Sulfurimonadaceae bacterium]|jgi:protein-tyrosine phosphatase/membrane-associated phospholipid phosphatase
MYTTNFNPALDAKSTPKERFVWMLYMGIVFFLLYGSANHYASLHAPHPSFFMAWEEEIPFIPSFIIPYISSDLLFCIAFLLPYTRLELRILALRVFFIISFSVLCFVLFPLQFSFTKPQSESFSFLFRLLQADLPFNQLPSLHISFAIVLYASMFKYLSYWAKVFVGFWFVLVGVSTLVVYQHHFIDIPSGAAVGLFALYLFSKKKQNYLTERFTTPRHLKIALYYLGASTLVLMAFFSSNLLFAPIFLWIFLSLFLVSLTYAFGCNDALIGTKGSPNLLQWLLFFPYFLGTYLSWNYYKRKIPLITHVKEHLYFGRFPTSDEIKELQALGIEKRLNLATEQQLHAASLSQEQLNFLDLTIPSAHLLHQAVEKIEQTQEKIFVHCALGLSRSVLVVRAWLHYKGYDDAAIDALLQEIRPNAVQSAYMQVALTLYKQHLQTLKVTCQKNENLSATPLA